MIVSSKEFAQSVGTLAQTSLTISGPRLRLVLLAHVEPAHMGRYRVGGWSERGSIRRGDPWASGSRRWYVYAIRILVTSTSGTGHLHPIVPPAQELRSAGHEIAWATAADACGAVERFGFRAFAVGISHTERTATFLATRLTQLLSLPPRAHCAFGLPIMFGEMQHLRCTTILSVCSTITVRNLSSTRRVNSLPLRSRQSVRFPMSASASESRSRTNYSRRFSWLLDRPGSDKNSHRQLRISTGNYSSIRSHARWTLREPMARVVKCVRSPMTAQHRSLSPSGWVALGKNVQASTSPLERK